MSGNRSIRSDPRPGRTKVLLFETLLGLIGEKRWEQIRVQDVLDRSGVGRSTFYTYFDNKLDLLTSAIPEVVVTVGDAESTLALFTHVEEMAPIMRPLMSQPVLGEIIAAFERSLVAAWTGHLTDSAPKADVAAVAMAASFLAGGSVSVAREWLATGCAESAQTVTERFMVLSSSVAESLA